MKPYSLDLRERALAALDAGDTQVEVAAQFGIHKSTLQKWWYRWQATGSCAALPPARGVQRTLHACQSFLRQEVKKQPDATLAELCERVAVRHGLRASVSMMCREVRILGLPRKKNRFMTANAKRGGSKPCGQNSKRSLSRPWGTW